MADEEDKNSGKLFRDPAAPRKKAKKTLEQKKKQKKEDIEDKIRSLLQDLRRPGLTNAELQSIRNQLDYLQSLADQTGITINTELQGAVIEAYRIHDLAALGSVNSTEPLSTELHEELYGNDGLFSEKVKKEDQEIRARAAENEAWMKANAQHFNPATEAILQRLEEAVSRGEVLTKDQLAQLPPRLTPAQVAEFEARRDQAKLDASRQYELAARCRKARAQLPADSKSGQMLDQQASGHEEIGRKREEEVGIIDQSLMENSHTRALEEKNLANKIRIAQEEANRMDSTPQRLSVEADKMKARTEIEATAREAKPIRQIDDTERAPQEVQSTPKALLDETQSGITQARLDSDAKIAQVVKTLEKGLGIPLHVSSAELTSGPIVKPTRPRMARPRKSSGPCM